MNKEFKSGFVAIIGRPNVGKSTLLNQLLNQKIVIVSPKAQTTRNKIQGIYNDDDCQIIFIDTPGFHKPRTELGKIMNDYVSSALNGVDVVLFMCDATKKIDNEDEKMINELLKTKIPTILVANKVDLIVKDEVLIDNMEAYRKLFPFTSGISISATNNYQVVELLNLVKSLLKKGPMYYPSDQLLNQPERFVVSEMIREKILLLTSDEVPHSVAVEIESFKESKPDLTSINATIVVERVSQKKIIIGSKGQKIKEIGMLSRKDIANFLGTKVYLELFVKVEENWRNHKTKLSNFGYTKEV